MQFLTITRKDTLVSLSRIIGAHNIDLLLAENGLMREPKIGAQYYKKCDDLLASDPPEVPAARKAALLNALTDSQEVFEKASLMDEEEWKIFSAFQSFRDALRLPESIQMPYSSKVIGISSQTVEEAAIGGGGVSSSGRRTTGGQGVTPTASPAAQVTAAEPVSSNTYRAVMKELSVKGTIPPEIFNTINTAYPVRVEDQKSQRIKDKTPQFAYNLPWGKIQMYSDVLKEVIDFPAYPEEISTSRSAQYVEMPDLIYQYEPWIAYEKSGPREQALSFHLHRDMWSGDHRDGRANNLIRFCEANTFPRFNGSIVQAPKIQLYIDGSLFISGVLVECIVNWSGPIGLDNWYLEFTLELRIQEVSDVALNIDTVRNFGLIGSYGDTV